MVGSPTKQCIRCGETKPLDEGFPRNRRRKDGRDSVCRECHRIANAIYRSSHAEHEKLRQAKYRAENPEKRRGSLARWVKANPERSKALHDAFLEAHPGYERLTRARRRARLANADGSHTIEDIQKQYVRQHGRCYYCGKDVGEKYHVDHVMPLAKGGSNGPENLVIACPQCNHQKKDKLPVDFCGRLL